MKIRWVKCGVCKTVAVFVMNKDVKGWYCPDGCDWFKRFGRKKKG